MTRQGFSIDDANRMFAESKILIPSVLREGHWSRLRFLLLALPAGLSPGYVSVAFPSLATRAGLSVETTLALVAFAILPNTWKFLWAPLVDTRGRPTAWYAMALGLSAVTLFLAALLPVSSTPTFVLGTVLFLSQVGAALLRTSCVALLSRTVFPKRRGAVGGFYQAGLLGGSSLGGGAGLWLWRNLETPWLVGVGLLLLMTLGATGLAGLSERPRQDTSPTVKLALSGLFTELAQLLRSRHGLIALAVCLLPLGSGAASNAWAAVASFWNVPPVVVERLTGFLGAPVAALGCLGGGLLLERWPGRTSYLFWSGVLGVCTFTMALSPKTPANYVVFTLAYTFFNGCLYAAFTGFILSFIGERSAVTSYTLFASLAYVPTFYMTRAEGLAHTHFGPSGLLGLEGAMTGVAILLVILVPKLVRTAETPSPGSKGESSDHDAQNIKSRRAF